ncbi:ABC transporter permease [Brevibacillus centrosporus]|uniref:Peptide/nickel transport system permease protein n=1 Tax=Brevibacillus centrosporus TaxID=54910 RepID=A0A1I3M7U8_9BACL|nr:ABC transporter permease [Brevibacillus centrosporus]MEC2130138.1 ABC transporter permease [Brevibacillus centrosporus]MED4906779.1 ABC transporter permease [Brevibacillus centrosporus]RNB65314.1 ABC transporter permease [Brevibacillus centrosporus]SFI93027.1 peptide/nickel transport system permease protein [Brevibacillus centrosporus]GED34597.1 peptide ABC transporter permease [Brevibacillus centrosporus]
MSRYILKRLLQMIPIVIGVSVIVFLLLSLSPGDPAKMILGLNAKEEELALMREQLGLNDPIPLQYFHYMKNVLIGDFGTSYSTKQSVIEMIAVRLPPTLILSFGSLLTILIVAIPLGIALAVKQNSPFDNIMRVVSLFFAAMPGFWIGILMIILFSVKLGWLPANGFDKPSAMIMPIICSSIAGWAVNSRITRASMLDVIRQDYIRTARAKGLKESVVIRKHALKNALLPTITSVGMAVGGCFGGSVIMEMLFGINGMGKMMIDALRQKDIPTIMAGVIITAVIIAVANLLTDLAYSYVDPRIRSMYARRRTIRKEVAGNGSN